MRCPIPSQNRPGPSCPGGGGAQWRRQHPPIEGPVLAHSTVRVWISIQRKEHGHLFWLVQTGQRGLSFMFFVLRGLLLLFFLHGFWESLSNNVRRFATQNSECRDIMFILPWFLVACRANSSNVSASSCPRDLAFAANSSKVRSRRASLGLFWDAIKCTFSLRSGMSSSFSSSFYVLCPLFHSSAYRLPLHPEIHIFCIKMKKDQDLFA